jgi:hypothetical protein
MIRHDLDLKQLEHRDAADCLPRGLGTGNAVGSSPTEGVPTSPGRPFLGLDLKIVLWTPTVCLGAANAF